MHEPPPSQPVVLLVDDVETNILMLNEVLRDEYRTLFATNGEDALRMTREKRPDLILLDIQMPGMDGVEVCKRLKEEPRTRRIPVIFITAISASATETEGLEAGAVDYITKPIRPDIVRLRVRNHLALKNYQDHLEELVRERTRELEAAKEAAEASDRAKTRYFMILGHELRTPLNVIIGFADLLIHTLAEDESIGSAQRILQSGERLHAIIENILDLVKLETGIVSPARHPFNLRELVESIGHSIAGRHAEKEIALRLEIAQDVPSAPTGDGPRVQQVLRHLLDNAFKFTPAGGSVRLTVTRGDPAEGTGTRLTFSIRDTGSGIPPEKRKEIFNAFTSGSDDPYTQHKGGVGVGLTIGYHLARLMQGQLTLQESGPEGSEFLFSVPCG
ncbi:MAG: response regulator [Magnetococcales bacterium]|nr:response regulator [Magnetococcales bacterium]